MMNQDELVDLPEETKGLPQSFKVISILSYIGNGILGISFLVLFLFGVSGTGMFSKMNTEYVSSPFIVGMTIAFLVGVTATVLSILGIIKMSKNNYSGWLMYILPNGVWIAFMIIGVVNTPTTNGVILLLVSLAFYIYYFSLRNYFVRNS